MKIANWDWRGDESTMRPKINVRKSITRPRIDGLGNPNSDLDSNGISGLSAEQKPNLRLVGHACQQLSLDEIVVASRWLGWLES